MSVDQMTELMRRENAENVRLMIGQLFQDFNAGDLRERQFREISCFTGEESQWKEWELKWAVSETDEVTMDDAREQFGDAGLLHSTTVYNRLITLLSGVALVIHQSVPAECGHEVWRLLHKRYIPMTPMRGIQLMLRVMNPGKVQKVQDMQTFINKYENISDRMKMHSDQDDARRASGCDSSAR